jgi:hypothetical protein
MQRSTAIVALAAVLSALAGAAENSSPQDISILRGGWFADVNGERHVVHLVANSTAINGIYCTDCTRPASLGVIDDAKPTRDGWRFTLYQGEASKRVTTIFGQLRNQQLILRKGSADKPIWLALNRANQLAKPAPSRNNPAGNAAPARPPAPAYISPGTPEPLSTAAIAGLWLAGAGPNKQYFSFKPFRGGLRGLVCGSCDDPNNMAVLDGIRIEGTTLHFDIAHEDNGLAFAEHGPHRNVSRAQIARNEMHLWVIPSFEPATFTPIEMTLLGPVRNAP